MFHIIASYIFTHFESQCLEKEDILNRVSALQTQNWMQRDQGISCLVKHNRYEDTEEGEAPRNSSCLLLGAFGKH